MELTPRLLTEVNFKEQWRGYSQNEVDEFLARVATAVGEQPSSSRAVRSFSCVADPKKACSAA